MRKEKSIYQVPAMQELMQMPGQVLCQSVNGVNDLVIDDTTLSGMFDE